MHKFTNLPSEFDRLQEIVQNLWWSWNPAGREFFRALDTPLWHKTGHNPIKILHQISDEKLHQAAQNDQIRSLYTKLITQYDNEMQDGSSWFKENYTNQEGNTIAYFSAEYGIHQSLPIYSGGLGILSGDTCKAASDLGIPLIGIGFLYQEGYFTQRVIAHGWQEADYRKLEFENLPAEQMLEADGSPMKVILKTNGKVVAIHVWLVRVGSVKLYLMDTDLDENKPWDRGLSSRLYGGDYKMRLDQEIVLGIGGLQLLRKLGIEPSVWHMNEGHAAFLTIGRIFELVRAGKTFEDALEEVRATTIFTTHTPVPAGHDKFGFDLIRLKFTTVAEELGIPISKIMQLGLKTPRSDNFNMTVLAMRCSRLINGVSKLHQKVTDEMFTSLLHDEERQLPLLGITNGIHVSSWISGPMRRLFSKYISAGWKGELNTRAEWDKLDGIPPEVFWQTRMEAKERMFQFIRDNAREQRIKQTMDAEEILVSGALLDPKVLTIGFARRFATYKRASLIMQDMERLRKMLLDPYRPVQIIFSGKAHPADYKGKQVLQDIYLQALDPKNGGRIVFLEDYDIRIARYLVQGVDVWMNNPIKPKEASGTSGMKAAINGIPNFSVLDGWFDEFYTKEPLNSWPIGGETSNSDSDAVESIYTTLENEIIPLYYQTNKAGIPEKWIKVSKQAIKDSIYNFSCQRMMKDYTQQMYFPQ